MPSHCSRARSRWPVRRSGPLSCHAHPVCVCRPAASGFGRSW